LTERLPEAEETFEEAWEAVSETMVVGAESGRIGMIVERMVPGIDRRH
jgi:hypothetical protein